MVRPTIIFVIAVVHDKVNRIQPHLFPTVLSHCSKYDQECALGGAGFASVISVICYMVAQNLLCCSPRPEPYYNLCKKKTLKKKKKKKKQGEEDEDEDEARGLTRDFDDPDYDGRRDNFDDEPTSGYADPYEDEPEDDDYDYAGESYRNPSVQDRYPSGNDSVPDSDVYSSAYDNDTYGDDEYDDGTYNDQSYAHGDGDGDSSYYTEDDSYDQDSNQKNRSGY